MSNLESATSEAVDDLLRSRGMTRATLERILRLSQPAISNRFTGKTPWSRRELLAIATYLDTDPVALLMPRSGVLA